MLSLFSPEQQAIEKISSALDTWVLFLPNDESEIKMRPINKDTEIMEILRKISDFSQECEHFRQKYGQNLEECKAAYEAGDEHFEQYDDLMAWEFAEQGKAYWEKQLQRGKVEHSVSL